MTTVWVIEESLSWVELRLRRWQPRDNAPLEAVDGSFCCRSSFEPHEGPGTFPHEGPLRKVIASNTGTMGGLNLEVFKVGLTLCRTLSLA
jgi:hypothetical protein